MGFETIELKIHSTRDGNIKKLNFKNTFNSIHESQYAYFSLLYLFAYTYLLLYFCQQTNNFFFHPLFSSSSLTPMLGASPVYLFLLGL